MKNLLFALMLLAGCESPEQPQKEWTEPFPEREDFEAMTNIVLPKNLKVISNPPLKDGEHVRRAILDLSQGDSKRLRKLYRFRPVNESISPLFESVMLDSVYRLIPNEERKNYLHKYGRKYSDPTEYRDGIEKNKKWLYLLDTSNNRLYCIISYPNLMGYAR